MRDWADSCANIRACRYRLLPESSSGCSRCTSGIGNAPWPKGIHDVPNGESILRANLCARQAAIERKTLENLATSLSDGSLAFQLQRLAELPKAAIVVESDYPDLFRTQPGRGSWLADMLGRLAVRYPEVPVIFAGSRKFAEEWAYRFLGAAVADHTESSQVISADELCSRRDVIFEPDRFFHAGADMPIYLGFLTSVS